MRIAMSLLGALLALLFAACSIIQGAQIEAAVLKALASDKRTEGYEFQVSYQGEGTVLITGEVLNFEIKDAVTEVAKTVESVEKVVNNCNITEEDSGLLQDTVVPSPFF
jgi:osmotically-inducible protein OsmY